jgi:hypothetical protein
MKHSLWLTTWVLAAAAAAASGAITDIQWSGEGRSRHETRVQAGKFIELCGKLAQGSAVRWKFESSAPLDFNIHYHVGKDVVYPTRLTQVAAAEDTLTAAAPQDYCWMWTNKGAEAVRLTVELRR